jgi:uncharacterized protein (TIGR02145 family)
LSFEFFWASPLLPSAGFLSPEGEGNVRPFGIVSEQWITIFFSYANFALFNKFFMKKFSCLMLVAVAVGFTAVAQNIGIGTPTPDSSALLELSSNSKGFLPPRMTTAERNTIANPAVGLQIYNTTTDCLEIFGKGKWHAMYCIPADTTLITDIDGNSYPTVKICNQTWTKKNLNVSRYRNGDIIPQVTDPTQWANLTTGAWCYYNNDSANGAVYGKLYNWYAVNDPRGLAPEGWHVPSDGEWNKMTKCLDATVDTTAEGWLGTTIGTQLKSTYGWFNGGNGSNTSGFTALPGGFRYDFGLFSHIGFYDNWWSTSDDGYSAAWFHAVLHDLSGVRRGNPPKKNGLYIRLIKDEPPSTLNDGLVAYYPFNGNANDESGNGNNGVVNGATLGMDRFQITNSCYEFLGNSKIDLGQLISLGSNPTEASYSFWLKINSLPTNNSTTGGGSGYPIFSKRHFQNYGYDWSTARINPNGKLYFFKDDDMYWGTPCVSNTIDLNSWVNFTLIKKQDSLFVYQNGITIDAIQDNYPLSGSPMNFILGWQGAWNLFLEGSLDDIRIYNRALTQEEISYLAGH